VIGEASEVLFFAGETSEALIFAGETSEALLFAGEASEARLLAGEASEMPTFAGEASKIRLLGVSTTLDAEVTLDLVGEQAPEQASNAPWLRDGTLFVSATGEPRWASAGDAERRFPGQLAW